MNFSTESPENYEQKCCCVLVLDVSSSMEGEPIKELNQGLQDFYKDIQMDSTTANRLEVAVIEFNERVRILNEPKLAQNFVMPTLTTSGSTALVDAVRTGINVVRDRKEWYKDTGQPYYRPWIILITDGAPDSNQDVFGLANEIKTGMNGKEFFFFALGVRSADMNMLNRISDPTMPASKMEGLKFSEFFKWLSASMTTVTHSKDGDKVNFPNPGSWMQGFTI